MMPFPVPVAAALRASVAVDPTDAALRSLEGTDLDQLGEAAAWHGVAGYVRATIPKDMLVGKPRRILDSLHEMTVLRHLQTVADLRYLRDCFDGAGIPWLVVKGPTLAEPVHGSADLRTYSDIDVLVPPRHLEAAIDVLVTAGADMLDRNWQLLAKEIKGEVHLSLPTGAALDLHWHLVNDQRTRAGFALGLAGLFDRRRGLRIGGLEVPSLGAADSLAYVALHAVLSGAHRLVWLKDVERLVTVEGELDRAHRRARRWGTELALVAAVDRASAAIDGFPAALTSPRAASVMDRAWRLGTKTLWRARPAEREDGAPSLARLVARATRTDGVSTFMTVVGKVLTRAREQAIERDEPDASGFGPGSGRYAAGGAVERRAFFDAITAHPDAQRD